MRWLVTVLAVLLGAIATEPRAGVVEDAAVRGSLRVAVVASSLPFSALGDSGAQGFAVELCEAVAEALAVPAAPVETMLADGIELVAQGRADLLCGPVTQTVARRERIDFSLPTFLGGAGFLVRDDASPSFRARLLEPVPIRLPRAMMLDLTAPRRLGVIKGSTTEALIRAQEAVLGAQIVTVDEHETALALLRAGRLQAYAAERSVLVRMLAQTPDLRATIAPRELSHEPFGLGLPRDDGAFRRVVDATLSRFYRDDRLPAAATRRFGAAGRQVTTELRRLALPE